MHRIVDDTASSHGASPQDATDDEDGATVVGHRNAPDADLACLYGLMSARDLTNGFANRFLMIWAERSRMLPFPKETLQAVVEHLARRTLGVLAFVRADQHDEREHLRMELSAQAQWRYAQFYRGELNDNVGDGTVGALLERRAPMLLRLAMLMALTYLQTRIDVPHIDAAMAWIQHANQDQRVNGRTPRRCAGHADACVPACVARKLISLVSPGQNACKCLSALSFR